MLSFNTIDKDPNDTFGAALEYAELMRVVQYGACIELVFVEEEDFTTGYYLFIHDNSIELRDIIDEVFSVIPANKVYYAKCDNRTDQTDKEAKQFAIAEAMKD